MNWLGDLGNKRREALSTAEESYRIGKAEKLAKGRSVSPMVKRLLRDLAFEYWSPPLIDRLIAVGVSTSDHTSWQISYPAGGWKTEGYWSVFLNPVGSGKWNFGVTMKDPAGRNRTLYTQDTDEEGLKVVLREAFQSGPARNYD